MTAVGVRIALLKPVFALRKGWHPGQAAVAASAMGGALVGGWLLFDVKSAVMMVAGSMAVLFARGEPYLLRARTVLTVGTLIVAMSALAYLAAINTWLLVVVLGLMAGVAGRATEFLHAQIPGPTLLLVPESIVLGVPPYSVADVGHRTGMVAIGVLLALAVTLAPWLVLRHEPQKRAISAAYQAIDAAIAAVGTSGFAAARNQAWAAVERASRGIALIGRDDQQARRLHARSLHARLLLAQAEVADHEPSESQLTALACRRTMTVTDGPMTVAPDPSASARPWQVTPLTLRLMVLTLVSGAVAAGLGLQRWYWTPVCAVAVIWGSHTRMTWHRAVQRAFGTVLGCVLALGFLQLHMGLLVSFAVIVALMFCAELLFPRNLGWAMALVTPLVLLMMQAGSPISLDGLQLSVDRVLTTLLACVFGVAGVLLLSPSESSSRLGHRIAASLALQEDLLDHYSPDWPLDDSRRLWLSQRVSRDLTALQIEATKAAAEARGYKGARALLPVVGSVQRLGYTLAALYWGHEPPAGRNPRALRVELAGLRVLAARHTPSRYRATKEH